MDYINQAKAALIYKGMTCVAINEHMQYESKKKGVAPLYDPLEKKPDFFKGCDVADRVIGKAAAMLLIKGKIKKLHAHLISEHAIQILDQYHISYTYDEKVPFIQNRTGTGMCPMEEAVLSITNIEEGFKAITEKRLLLMNITK